MTTPGVYGYADGTSVVKGTNMYSTELLYQLGKLRQQELVREMEQARLINSAVHGRPARRSILSKSIKGFRLRRSNNLKRTTVTLVKQSNSHICCFETKA